MSPTMMKWCVALATTILLHAVPFSAAARAQESVSFPSTDADLRGGTPTIIKGYLYRPDGPGPFPAVIGMHGCNGVVDQGGKIVELVGAWGERLSREGYLVLLPDSFGSRGHGDLCAVSGSARPVQPSRDIPRDSYGALAYLRSRSDVKHDGIAILGQSFGAASMFYTIAEGTRPPELSPDQDFRAAIAFYPSCQPFLAREPKWKPRVPLLFLMGEADDFARPAPCRDLLTSLRSTAAPRVQAQWYPGAYHAFDHPNLPERVMTNVKLPPHGHSPTVGSNPGARADAVLKVKAFLADHLR